MRAFILGAGFSKPAGMPLATDLTSALIDRATRQGDLTEMRGWLDSLTDRLNYLHRISDQKINVEEIFHYAHFDAETHRLKHQMASVGRHDGQTSWNDAESIETWLGYMEESLIDELWEQQTKADLQPIVRWAQNIDAEDRVISFNYDTLVEHALRTSGMAWSHGMPEESETGRVKVLKLHGSIDWLVFERAQFNSQNATLLFRKRNANDDLGVRESATIEDSCDLIRVNNRDILTNAIQNRDLAQCYQQFALAGLGSYKPLHRIPGLAVPWVEAGRAILEADEIIIVGFSLSQFDAMARLKFAGMIKRRSDTGCPKPKVTLIDPGADDERKADFEAVFGEVECICERHEVIDWTAI